MKFLHHRQDHRSPNVLPENPMIPDTLPIASKIIAVHFHGVHFQDVLGPYVRVLFLGHQVGSMAIVMPPAPRTVHRRPVESLVYTGGIGRFGSVTIVAGRSAASRRRRLGRRGLCRRGLRESRARRDDERRAGEKQKFE